MNKGCFDETFKCTNPQTNISSPIYSIEQTIPEISPLLKTSSTINPGLNVIEYFLFRNSLTSSLIGKTTNGTLSFVVPSILHIAPLYPYFLFRPNLTFTFNNPFVTCKFFQCHWPASMQFLCTNPNFGTQPELRPIGKCC